LYDLLPVTLTVWKLALMESLGQKNVTPESPFYS